MKSAMVIASELGCSTIPEQTLRGATQVEIIRNKRLWGDQDVAFGARPFILCGLPICRLPQWLLNPPSSKWKVLPRSGRPSRVGSSVWPRSARASPHGHPGGATPESGDPLPKRSRDSRRVGNANQRHPLQVSGRRLSTSLRQHDVLWNERGSRDNSMTLSPAFWQEFQEHPIPVDAEVVRLLARNPGCLDTYTWLTWRCPSSQGASASSTLRTVWSGEAAAFRTTSANVSSASASERG
jgi:hypothetical protein